ncbi:MAG TPA: lysophospholipid acyltransferase family protein [Candidatus Limnocylindrales bacterium]
MPDLARGRDRSQAGRRGGLVGKASPRAPRLYRFLLLLCRGVARLLGFRLVLEHAERLPRRAGGSPAGGWIAAGLPHRTWIDPFVLALLLPIEPRINWLGDGRAIYRSRLRRLVFDRIGGVVPIWPGRGPAAFEEHVAAAKSVIDSGAVFGLFPEVGPAVPVERARPLSAGVAYFALRSNAPIVPLVLGGAHELYLGRTIILSVLEPVTARELAGLEPDAPLPDPGTPEERDAAARMTERLQELTAGPVADAHERAEPPPGTRKHWRWLTSWTH